MDEEHKEDTKTTQTVLKGGEQAQRELKRESDGREGRRKRRLSLNGKEWLRLSSSLSREWQEQTWVSLSMKNSLLCSVLHFPEISAFLPPGNH